MYKQFFFVCFFFQFDDIIEWEEAEKTEKRGVDKGDGATRATDVA